MPLHTYGRAKDMSRNGASPPNDKLWLETEQLDWLQLSCSFLFLKTGFHFTGILLFCQIERIGVSLHKPLFWILVDGFKGMEA